jgi:glutamate-1-semialdehyde aminotransferase
MTPKNQRHYHKALKIIPWASQTNAKRWDAENTPSMPPFIKHADGCRVWDLDGKEYIDFRCALGPIILGYRYPAVENAVKQQMENGVLFSMASPLESETAEAIVQSVPWIEQIRFVKTGADACTACVRLARAYTKRDHIVTSGFHGFHDSFVTDREDAGVPSSIKAFVHPVNYGDVEAVERVFKEHGDQIAAAIVEPCEWHLEPSLPYLQQLRVQCDASGSLLIYDEVLTGFRLGLGGAQAYFGVTPDLAAFAKSLANGYPLAAFAGKRRFMQAIEQTLISTTYGGETLSLAASKATMEVMQTEPVHDHIFEMGNRLRSGFEEIIRESGLPAQVIGLPPAPAMVFHLDDQNGLDLRNRFFDKLFENGVFANHPWVINYSHQPDDIDRSLEAVRQACREL